MAGKRRVFLQVLKDGEQLAEAPLARPPMLVGSAEGSGLTVRSKAIALVHASFDVEDGRRVVVTNLAGPGRLTLRGDAVERASLQHGDVVSLGPVQIRIDIRRGAKAAPPSPAEPEPASEPEPAPEPEPEPPPEPEATPEPAPEPEPEPEPLAPTPEPLPEGPPIAFLILTTADGGARAFELPVGRFAAGSGPCAIHIHDPEVAAITGEWFRAPEGNVYYRAASGGTYKACENGRTEGAGPVKMQLILARGNQLRSLRDGVVPGSGTRSARRTREEVECLARQVTVDFGVPAPETIPDMPAVKLPEPPKPPKPPPKPAKPTNRSPWVIAPLLIILSTATGAGVRLLQGPDPTPTSDVVEGPDEGGGVEQLVEQVTEAETPAPEPATFETGSLVVLKDGGTDEAMRNTITAALWKRRQAHRRCFDPVVEKQADTEGVMWLEVLVTSDGRVADAWVHAESTITEPGVASCLLGYFGAVQLPKPPAPPFQFVYPLELSLGRITVPTGRRPPPG